MQFKEETSNTTIKTYPKRSFDTSMTEVTLDEFRGNPLVLLNFLIKQGFVEFGPKDYDSFVKLCTMPPLQMTHVKKHSFSLWGYAPVINEQDKYKENLSRYIAQFDALVENIKVIDKIRLIRLLDMGLVTSSINDYCVLKLLHRLQREWARFEIIVSTSGVEFVEALEKFQDNQNRLLLKRLPKCEDHHSTQALTNCFDLNILKPDKVIELYDKVYKNHLKLLSYTMSVDRNELCVFSHAKIGLNHIRSLANLFEINYLAKNIGELAMTIDAINEVFASRLAENNVHSCYQSDMLKQDYKGCPSNESAFADFVWGREVSETSLNATPLAIRFIHTQVKDKQALLTDGPYLVYSTNSQKKMERSCSLMSANPLNITPNSVKTKSSPNSVSPFCLFELEDILKPEAKTSETSPISREFKHG